MLQMERDGARVSHEKESRKQEMSEYIKCRPVSLPIHHKNTIFEKKKHTTTGNTSKFV